MNAPHRDTPEWADRAPGAQLAAALEAVEVEQLDDSPVVDLLVAVERQIAHLHAVQMKAMAELSLRENYAFCGGCDEDDETSMRHQHSRVRAVGSEVSAALACTPGQADAQVALALELIEDLPATYKALHAGRIDRRRAELIATRTRVLADAWTRHDVEDRVLPTAGEMTMRQLARVLDREVIRADPAAAEQRRQRARHDRRVEKPRSLDGADGAAEMVLTGPVEDLAALYTAVDAAARAARTDGDPRTLDQLRFDIATGLGWNGLKLGHLGCCATTCTNEPDEPDGSEPPGNSRPSANSRSSGHPGGSGRVYRTNGTQHGRAATVNVTIAYTTLLGLDDEPAELDGYGPITAEVGRIITADATLRRMLTDPADGQLLEYGRTTYTPPQALAEFIIARDVTCRFPTSDTPARLADIDHRIPYERGGTTGKSNNQALGRRFHLDKTLHGWELYQPSPGTFVWISPAGRKYRTLPQVVDPTHHPPPAESDPPPF